MQIHSDHCETCAAITSAAALAMANHIEALGRYNGNGAAHDAALVHEREVSHGAALVLDAWFDANVDIVARAREYDVNVMTTYGAREPRWPNGLLDAYSGFGKYERERCIVAVLDGMDADETTGDVETFKAYSLYLNLWEALPALAGVRDFKAMLLWEDAQGFVQGYSFASQRDASHEMREVAEEYRRIATNDNS